MHTPEEITEFFAKYIFVELGIVYTEANYYQLRSRLVNVAKQLNFPTIEALFESAKRDIPPPMRLLLLDSATNNETLFFRDQAIFTAIETKVLGVEGVSKDRNSPLRVWSAACSTGEEVYSLAIMFERLRSYLPQGKYEILATDICERVLRRAEAARFTQLQVHRGLTDLLLAQHFDQKHGANGDVEWQIKQELRTHITFKKQKRLESFVGLGSFDLIMCRNVLIYQATEEKRAIIARLHERLNEGGFLVLGAAESLIGLSDDFEMVRTERATLYRKLPKKIP